MICYGLIILLLLYQTFIRSMEPGFKQESMKGKRDNLHMSATLKAILIKLFLDNVSSPPADNDSVEDVNTTKAAWAFHVTAISATRLASFRPS